MTSYGAEPVRPSGAPTTVHDTPEVHPEDTPLPDSELHVEPLRPFTWRTTLYSLVAWPLPFLSIMFWYAVLRLADLTFWPVGKMLALPRFAARMTLWLGGVRVKVYGVENLDLKSGRYVFTPNHVSMMDAPVCAVAGRVNARAFQASWQVKIPIYGGFVKMFDEVLVDLKDPESRRRAFEEALRRIRSGGSFGVFPEGKRSYDGKLGPFYPGAFRLAITAGVPIVPVAIRGLRNICPPGEWRARPGVVEFIYGEPIPTDGLTLQDVERLSHRTRRAINRMLREGPAGRQLG